MVPVFSIQWVRVILLELRDKHSLECKNAYWGEESCGGPVERKCCRPPSTNPSTSSTESVPTVPQEPSEPTDTGMSTGAIVGIIVGSVAILGSVVGISYYYGKNKSSGEK